MDLKLYKEYFKIMPESGLLTTYIDNFEKITSFKGIYNCFDVGDDFYLTNAGNNYDVVKIEHPIFKYFKETTLDEANEIKRNIGNVVTVGRYETGFISDLEKLTYKNASNKYNLLFTQFRGIFNNYIEQENNPNILFFDIETASVKEDKAINIDKYPILAIGMAIGTGKPIIIDSRPIIQKLYGVDVKDIESPVNNHMLLHAEKILIMAFLGYIEKHNIDLMVGFNSITFDMSYIMKRAFINKIPSEEINKLFKYKFEYFDSSKLMNRCKKIANGFNKVSLQECTNFLGRNHIDIFKMWYNKGKMKNIAKDLGLISDPLDLDPTIMWHEFCFNYDLFIRYLFLDIEITRELYLINADRIKTNLEDLNCGMTFIAQKTTTTIPTQIFANALSKDNIETSSIAINTNPFFMLQSKHYYNAANNVSYAGALTGIESVGLIRNASKQDAGSYYPNTIITYNFGLSNTQVVDIIPYNGEFSFIPTENFTDFIIPDHKIKINIVIRKYNFACPSVNIIENAYNDRKIYKDLEAKASEEKNLAKYFLYKGINEEKKVFINGIYGEFSMLRGISNPPSAMLTTSMGRYGLAILIHIYKDACKLADLKFNPIGELDTDGLITRYLFIKAHIDRVLSELAYHTGACVKNTILFDVDIMTNFYIKSTKNYIHYDEQKGKWTIKGSSLKGSKHTKMETKFLKDIFIKEYIENKMSREELYDHVEKNFSTLFEITDFIIPKKNIQNINSYKTTSIERKLGYQYEKEYGVKAEKNSNLSYFKISSGSLFLLATDGNIELLKNGKYKIDEGYYLKKLDTLAFKEV